MLVLSEMASSDAAKLLKDNIGATVTLTADYMTHKGGSEWAVKSVNSLGGTCVVSVAPVSGGKGFFAPYKHFSFKSDLAPAAAPEPEPDAVVEAAPAAVRQPVYGPRNEFSIEGFDPDAPLYELFAAVAPDSDAAREFFLTYAAEYSEFDTEFLENLMRSANVVPNAHWSDVNVTQMLMLLGETQKDDIEEDENGPTVAARMKKILDEQAVVEPVESKPAVTIHPDVKPYLVSDTGSPDPAAPRKRGRPPGAKNKPKLDTESLLAAAAEVPVPKAVPAPVVQPQPVQPAMTALEEDDLADVLDNLPPAAVIVEPTAVIREVPVQECRVVWNNRAYKLAAAVLGDLGNDSDPGAVIDDMVVILRRALGL